MKRVTAILLTGLLSSACSNDGLVFYEVVRSRVAECLIRSNGEFCVEPDQFDPPSVEVWTVETRADRTLLYANEEVWILDTLPDDAEPTNSPQSTGKVSVVLNGETGCRTDAVRAIEFIADRDAFDGTLTSRTVTTGPAACGSTPIGERRVDSVIGSVSGP